ncbi:MAG: MOSC domain-containing protein [Dehalococcoidia bacterium]|nr:MOSC domain-containing protein [Dehalococcoidia bacterium]
MTGKVAITHINVSNGGVPKLPIERAVIGTLGVESDRQANTEHHGGPERALCLFSLERIEALQAEGHPITPGGAGENITITGLDWDAVAPGTQLRLGDSVLIEITGYTAPCYKIEANFSGGDFNRINQKTNPGWSRAYARVLEGGPLLPGDSVELLPGS